MIAGQRPDLVRAMVIETAYIYYEPKIHTGSSAMIELLRSGQKLKTYLTRLHGERGPEMGDQWLHHWLDANNVPESLVAPDLLRSVSCPVLIVQGVEDEYANEQHAIAIHSALPDSTLWLIPDCGHVPHAALGEEFNRRVAGFFANTSRKRTD